jgi:integrase
MSRRRGTGSVFQREGCKTWSIAYYLDGQKRRERTGTTDRAEAQRILTRKLYQISQGEIPMVQRETVRVRQIWDAMTEDYRANGRRRAVRDFGTRWKHLGPVFGLMSVRRVTTADVRGYIKQRQSEGAANATINREVGSLKRAFNLAQRQTPPLVERTPYMPMLKEDNRRTGFVEDEQFDRLAAAAGELWLRTFLELAYTYGFRHEELLALRVEQMDLRRGVIRLEPGTTKNKEGRIAVMNDRARALVAECVVDKEPTDYVLSRRGKRPIRDFRWTWRRLCVAAGLGTLTCRVCGRDRSAVEATGRCPACKDRHRPKYAGLIPHDLRRSAAKAMRLAGVPESTVMQIGGWKTDSTFRRYLIQSHADAEQAVRLLDKARADRAAKAPVQTGLISVPIGQETATVALPLVSRKVQ